MPERRRRWLRRGVAVGAGLALGLSRPPVDLGPLALVALIPLLWLWQDDSPRGAAGHGFLAGAAYHAMVVSWAWYFGAVAIVPFVAALAAYWAVAGATVAVLRRRGFRGPWLTAAIWVVVEGIVARGPLGGFSWAEVGYAAHDLRSLRSVAALGGLPLVSFVVVAVNAAILDLIDPRSGRRRAGAAWLVATATVVAVWFVAWPETTPSGRMHVAMLQGNDKNRDLTTAELDARYLPRQHFALAAQLEGHYDLVVFPESSLDADPRSDPWLTGQIVAVARRLDSYVLVNATTDADPAGKRASNLNLLYDRSGRLVGTYAKRHLVPYGEYVPGRALLEPLIPALEQIPRDFAPGKRPGLFDLRGDRGVPDEQGNTRIASVICFESAFGYELRPLVDAGAEVIVVSTNNRSYRRSSNSWQHVEAGQMRAVETGRPLLQAAISGHSAIIDPRGDVVAHTELFRNGVLDTRIVTRRGETPYVRFGDWALGAAMTLVVFAGATAWARGRRSGSLGSESVDSATSEETDTDALVRGST